MTTIMPNTRRNTGSKEDESIHLNPKLQASNLSKNLDQGIETHNGMSRGSTVINNIDTISSNTIKLSKDQDKPVVV